MTPSQSNELRLTEAQKEALQLAIDSGGELILGGFHGQEVNTRVTNRLLQLELIRWGGLVSFGTGIRYLITEAGRQAIQQQEQPHE